MSNAKFRNIGKLLITTFALALFACGIQPKDRLQQGLHETSDQSVFWVAMDKEIKFVLAMDLVDEVIEKNENWNETEFNVYYTFRTQGRRAPVLIYGDINDGIITAAYRDEPLDLEQGMFLIEKEGNLVQMTTTEKESWLSQIDR